MAPLRSWSGSTLASLGAPLDGSLWHVPHFFSSKTFLPATAKFATMPQAGVATGCVDFVLHAEKSGKGCEAQADIESAIERSPDSMPNSEVAKNYKLLWIGVAVGVGVSGLGFALARSRKISAVKSTTSADLPDLLRDMLEHIKIIYDEGLQVVAEATEVWNRGRNLVRLGR